MITFHQYRSFLASLSAKGIHAIRADQLAGLDSTDNLLVIKHDVEADLETALAVARIEQAEGHKATYYFQGDLLRLPQARTILQEIGALGHEVAYHYDVLDACEGDYAAARREFESYKELLEGQSGQPLRTVCPHGNPTKVRNGWRSNKDFFRNPEVRQAYPDIVDIVVDFDRLLPNGAYVSDAGFTLRRIGNIAGNDRSNQTAMQDGTTLDWSAIAALVEAGGGVVLSIHSHRLRSSELAVWILKQRMAFLRSGYRAASRIPGVRSLASRMYRLARRF